MFIATRPINVHMILPKLSQYDRIGLDTTPSSSAEKPKIEREDADTLDGLCVTFARFRVASAGRRRQHDLNIRIFLQGIDEWANRVLQSKK